MVFREDTPLPNAPLPQIIPWDLLRGIAIIDVYSTERFIEPPRIKRMPLSLAFHQTLATLASVGELTPKALAARILFASGAQRVLIVDIRPSPRIMQDGLWLASACMESGIEINMPGTAKLTIQIPEHIGTLSFGKLSACMELGKQAAARELDGLLDMLGMAHCRVLPFRRS